MLNKLKKFLLGNEKLSNKEIENIRNYFNEILNYQSNDLEKPIDSLNNLYNTFRDIFPYSGIVYRGIFIGSSLSYIESTYEVCAFTNNKNVAENFAMHGENGDCYLITQEVCNALYFSELLAELEEKGILLTESIENFIGEDEVLCFLNKEHKIKKIGELY